MKKTLLTIALAALATSAFAGNVYKYDSATSTATLDLNTTIKYKSHFTRDTLFDFDSVNKDGKVVYTKEKARASHFKPEVKFAIAAKGLDKESGFFISSFGEVKSKADYWVQPKGKEVKNLYLNKAFVGFGSNEYGSFQVGKVETVADYKFSSFSNTDVLTTSAHDAETKFDFVVNYFTPVYAGLQVGASFGETKTAVKELERQFAGLVSYKNFGANFTLVGYKNSFKKDDLKQLTQVGVDLSASYEIYHTNLVLSTGYATTHHSKSALTGDVALSSQLSSAFQKHKAWDVAFEASNSVFSYAQPYLGVYYVQEKARPQDRLSYNKVKSLTTLVGVNSDLFEVASLKASSFVEAGYNLSSSSYKDSKTSELLYKVFDRNYNLGFGVKVTF